MKNLRLAIIRQRYTPFGGAERIIGRTMEALQERGVQVTMITRKWQGGDSFKHIICDPFYWGRLWRDWSFAQRACRIVEQGEFDLVQSHTRIACCDLHRAGDGVHREWLVQRGRAVGWLSRLAVAVSPYHRYQLVAERRLFENPGIRAIICNSEMVRNEIIQSFNISPDKLHVIYSGVDTEAYHPRLRDMHRDSLRQRLNIPLIHPMFLFVGSGFLRKGVAATLHALARIATPIRLVIVGQDKKARYFARLAERLGVAERVHFAGPQREVAPYYGAADAAILPTLYDPFPNVALEAMAAGLPLITSTKSGAAELIRDGENGFVRDALDIAGIEEAMRQVAKPNAAQAMGLAARATVEPLTLSKMSQQLLALYDTLLDDRPTTS